MERFAEMRAAARTLAIDGKINAVIAHDARQQVHVREIGNVLKGKPVVCEQRRDDEREGRVLRARDRDRAIDCWPPTILIRSMWVPCLSEMTLEARRD